jgi:GTP cyclohydrolase II
LWRIHSSCLTGDTFHSLKCDCGDQLDEALRLIAKSGGILIYLAQEWRDIGLLNKIRAYALQDLGHDTVDANEQLWLPADNRQYLIVKEILETLKIKSLRLITNNPLKVEALETYWIAVTERVPIIVGNNEHNKKYLKTKQVRMGHLF